MIISKDTIDSTARKRDRIGTLDILRGLFLVVIAVDHFAWTPSLFIQILTERSLLFASAAEGFFAISGILVGYIYGPRILKTTKLIVFKIWKRALLLYCLSVGFTILYTVWYTLYPSYHFLEFVPLSTPTFLVNTLTLQHTYGWADFLNRYAVFMFISPLALWLIAKGRWYVVAAVSFAIWLSVQSYGVQLVYTAWQLPFMGGVIIGYYLPAIESSVAHISTRRRKVLTKILLSVGVSSYFLAITWLYLIMYANYIDFGFGANFFNHLNVTWIALQGYFTRDHLAIGRVIIGTLWFWTLYVIIRKNEKTIDKHTKGVLTLLGKNSLFVYSLHAFLLYLIGSLLPHPNKDDIFINTLFGLCFITILVATTVIKNNLRDIIKRKL